MKTLKERIANLESSIANARQAAQYADGQAYYDDMRRITEMENRLSALRKEQANVSANKSA